MTEKFKALVHYVVASAGDPQRLGATRLNKILWFSDTLAYRLTGVPISGETYVKRQRGPVPKHILRTIRELESTGKIHVREREHFRYRTRLFVALEEPDTTAFSTQELAIVDAMISEICGNHTAASISDLSHDEIWDAANEGEEIPIHTSLVSQPGEFTEELMRWADSVVEKVEARRKVAA
jgi:hypothetical protein